MVKSKQHPQADALLDMLERAIADILADKKTDKKEKNDAIANGIKLAQIKFKINPDSVEEFFGGTPSD